MEPRKCTVNMIWHVEDGLGMWCAESDDIPGMVTSAPTFDALIERVRVIAPEMLECNLNYKGPITLDFVVERTEYLEAV